jgi:lipopolysaccharide/colanic/teichoic acid biosynthesis glycosyltransferase
MQALTNQPKNANALSLSKTIRIVYVGEIKELSFKLKCLDGIDTHVSYYDNSIVAYHELKHNKVKADMVICDANVTGINAIELHQLTKRIAHLNLVYLIVTKQELSQFYIERAREMKIDDIIQYPISLSQLAIKIKMVIVNKMDEVKIEEYQKPRINFLKRTFDVTFSLLALLMLSPLFLIVAILIKIDSKGPVFFTSKRVGSGYQIFDFFKFRSMKTGAENLIDNLKGQNQYKVATSATQSSSCEECERLGHACSSILFIDGKHVCENSYFSNKKNSNSSFMKFKDDPRVTKLGAFLRKSSIDELPQLLNILKGDMSFVGNRPLPLYEAEQLTSDNWAERFNAPAGLTGLWQVSKRGKADMSEEERKQLDNTYARTHSFFGDIVLILRTFPALTQKESV